jgi:hypothetical protein
MKKAKQIIGVPSDFRTYSILGTNLYPRTQLMPNVG